MAVHDNIRMTRVYKALSQRELAEKAGLNVATICRIETGQHKPHPSTIRRIAMALEVRPEELMIERV